MVNPLGFSDPNKSYKFGEIFCTFDGLMTFHCNYCPSKVKDFVEFSIHYTVHLDEVFVIKTEDETFCDTNVYIDEKEPDAEANIEEVNISSFRFDDSKEPTKIKRKRNSRRELRSKGRRDIKRPIVKHKSTVIRPPKIKNATQKSSKNVDRPKLTCTSCNQQFIHKTTMEKHLKSHEFGFLQSEYECDICERKIKSKKDLLDHMRKKHAERKYACELCGKVCSTILMDFISEKCCFE